MMDVVGQIDPRLAERIAEKRSIIDRARPLSPSTVRLLDDELRSVLTYHSNAIEGNTLSLRETQLIIEHGMTVAGHSLREHLEATNHAEAFDLLRNLTDRRTDITIEMILDIHRVLMDKILDADLAGHFRPMAVSISGSRHVPPPAREVPHLMNVWCDWLTGAGLRYPALVRAAVAHHAFLAVHPFRDGNGRTARLLLNLMLLRDGYAPALLLREWRTGYVLALGEADRGRHGPILNMIGRAVEQGLDRYVEALRRTPLAPEADEQLLSDLAPQTEHSADYLALLIRKGRLAGIKRGGRWYSSLEAVRRYDDEVQRGVYPRGRPRKK
jgi:fido (protein-threonine AMPylation protein)